MSSQHDEHPAETEAREGKDKAILALLAKLSLHYWRPDFTPTQAKQLYADYLEDLRPFALSDIANAIAEYRQIGANRFYPSTGQLIDLIIGKAEVQSHRYSDEFQALQRRRSSAIAHGTAERERVVKRLKGIEPELCEPISDSPTREHFCTEMRGDEAYPCLFTTT